jgi:two-component system sensor histidine kinase/response regulator
MFPNPMPPKTADLLIVDDLPDNLRLLSTMLNEQGYKVRTAINGSRALQAAEAVPPDLVLLDINMPDINGYEVCKRLKQDPQTQNIPIIFISALDDVFDKVMAFDVGGVDYITKPFQMQEVLARVANHLQIRTLQKQLQDQNEQLQAEVRDRMAAQRALEALNQELEDRVRERTAELEAANEQLRTLEAQLRQQLNVFLHAVSHDLRNPVIGTSMVLNNLIKQTDDPVQIPHAVVERMAESSARQLELINSLIDTHSAEVWGISLHRQPLRLNTLVSSAIADLQPMLERDRVTVENQIDADLPVIQADPLQLARVYQNLVANALKHNPPGLTLTFTAQVEGDALRCTVADDGIGISPEEQAKLFDLYFQGKQKRRSVGLGLGLYLCQQVIESHGGTIGVDSTLGEGSTFWFTLPLHPEQPSKVESPLAEPEPENTSAVEPR